MNIKRFKEKNCLTLKKARSRSYPAETNTGADYADDPVLLANKSVQTGSLLYSLEEATRSNGFFMNLNKHRVHKF